MKISMPNKHLNVSNNYLNHRKHSQHLFAETKNALDSLVLMEIQNYLYGAHVTCEVTGLLEMNSKMGQEY